MNRLHEGLDGKPHKIWLNAQNGKIRGYCARVLTAEEVRRLLKFDSRFDVDDFLAAHDVPFYTLADLEHDRETSQRLGL